jgi:hypothetical protein
MAPPALKPEVMPDPEPGPKGAGPPPLPGAGLPRARLVVAFAIAGISDVISVFTELVPPVQWAVDFITALLLFVVLGWRWPLLAGFVMEAIPGVALFPAWVLVVGAVAVWGTARPRLN